MFKNRKWLIICCLLLTLVGITVRQNIKPNPVISTTTTTTTTKPYILLGIYTVTAYNSLSYQTDNTPCISASGMNVCETEDLICACPREFEFGTEFFINGRWWNCQDRLHSKYDDRIDLLIHTIEDAKEFGKQELEVYIINPQVIPNSV